MTRAALLRRAVIAALSLALVMPFVAPTAALAAPIIHEFPLAAGASGPEGIVTGPDHNLWVAVQYSNQIARVTPTGGVTMYTVPTVKGNPIDIAVGPGNNPDLWFSEYGDPTTTPPTRPGMLGRISTSGAFSEINLGKPMAIWGVTKGPDGNMWFTEFDNERIGRIAPTATSSDLTTLMEFRTPTPNSFPSEITVGPDGNLWFAEEGASKIGRITPAGVITEFPLPNVPPSGDGPCGIVAGPDGNIWFAEQDGNKIGRITPAGVITEFSPPTPVSGPIEMTLGPDGNVWFAEGLVSKIGRVTMAGVITEYATPTGNSVPYGVTTGPDGNLWFTEDNASAVGYIDMSTVVKYTMYLPLLRR